MSQAAFFADEARTRTTKAIEAVEAQTAAEVVVALRKSSGLYRHSDYLFAFLLALVALWFVLTLPEQFPAIAVIVDLAVVFVVASAVCKRLPFLRRVLSGRRLMEHNVRTAANAAFHELGVSRTSGRTGVLVYVSMLERRVELVADLGVDVGGMKAAWTEVSGRLQASLHPPRIDAFLEALAALGPVLAQALPRRADDRDELSNEVRAP